MKEPKPTTIEVVGDNWKVGNRYYQEYPTAYMRADIKDETTLDLYHDTFEVFKGSEYAVVTKAGKYQYKIERESDTQLYSNNKERLILLAFESKLKKGIVRYGSFKESCSNIAVDLIKEEQPEHLKKENK